MAIYTEEMTQASLNRPCSESSSAVQDHVDDQWNVGSGPDQADVDEDQDSHQHLGVFSCCSVVLAPCGNWWRDVFWRWPHWSSRRKAAQETWTKLAASSSSDLHCPDCPRLFYSHIGLHRRAHLRRQSNTSPQGVQNGLLGEQILVIEVCLLLYGQSNRRTGGIII